VSLFQQLWLRKYTHSLAKTCKLWQLSRANSHGVHPTCARKQPTLDASYRTVIRVDALGKILPELAQVADHAIEPLVDFGARELNLAGIGGELR
jgi:hypothetical protein